MRISRTTRGIVVARVLSQLLSVAELVNSMLNLYQGRLSNSGIVVEARYASAMPFFCYEYDIRQMLSNLVANAIDAIDAMRGGGRLVVRAHDAFLGGSAAVRISIADTGHGMSAKTRADLRAVFIRRKI